MNESERLKIRAEIELALKLLRIGEGAEVAEVLTDLLNVELGSLDASGIAPDRRGDGPTRGRPRVPPDHRRDGRVLHPEPGHRTQEPA